MMKSVIFWSKILTKRGKLEEASIKILEFLWRKMATISLLVIIIRGTSQKAIAIWGRRSRINKKKKRILLLYKERFFVIILTLLLVLFIIQYT